MSKTRTANVTRTMGFLEQFMFASKEMPLVLLQDQLLLVSSATTTWLICFKFILFQEYHLTQAEYFIFKITMTT